MRQLPIFLDLQGRRALVLGGGEIAERKAEALRRAGAEVVFALRFDPALLQGCAVAIGADAELAELEALSRAAQAASIPVNVVDRPELCSFITPSVIDRDPLLVAVSTGGAAPVLARLVRARIEALIPPAWGRLAALADSLKEETRRALPDVLQRRRVLERVLGGRVADLVIAGRDEAARAEMRREIDAARGGDAAVAATGIVYLVGAGPGAPDLLTLRAHRLMGEADVVVHDTDLSGALLDMARRDADRVAAPPGVAEAAALLVQLGQEGRKVVRLAGAVVAAEQEALAVAGVAFEVVPGVSIGAITMF